MRISNRLTIFLIVIALVLLGLFSNQTQAQTSTPAKDAAKVEAAGEAGTSSEMGADSPRYELKFLEVIIANVAWKMSYTIADHMATPEVRWGWVNLGIRTLRDFGIPMFPQSERLRRELAWIYSQKIGQFDDKLNWYFKRQFAGDMQEIVGSQPRGATTQQAIEAFGEIVNAPHTVQQVLKNHPDFVPVYRMIRELGYAPDTALLRLLARMQMLSDFLGADATPQAMAEMLGDSYNPKLDALRRDPKNAAGFKEFTLFLRRQALINDCRMSPEKMLRVMEKFGPLDWRSASSHGVYWTVVSAESRGDLNLIDRLSDYRLHVHALQELMRFGWLSFDPVTQHIDLLPDPRFIPIYELALEQARDALLKAPNMNVQQINNSYEAGHENFLLQAICFAYLYGDPKQAAELFDKASKTYGMKPHNQFPRKTYLKPIEDLVLDQFFANVDMATNSRHFIDALLSRAFSQGLANGRMDVFNSFVEIAKLVHKRFQDKAIANPNAVQVRREQLPFDEILATTYLEFIRSSSVSLLLRSRIWKNSPLELQQRVYDRVIKVAQQQLANSNIDAAKVFPEPPGMAEFRQQQQKK